jgi:hypothetical protein
MIEKQVEILRELVPGASKIALLVNPGNPMHRPLITEVPGTARKLGLALPIVEATTAEELDTSPLGVGPTRRQIHVGDRPIELAISLANVIA